MIPAHEWARCRPLIEAALATGPGFETIEDVERLLQENKYQVWFAPRSCVISEIVTHANGRKTLHVVHMGGDLDELLEMIEPAICRWATAQGCGAIWGEGRRGWDRVMPRRGYRFAYVTMIKELE